MSHHHHFQFYTIGHTAILIVAAGYLASRILVSYLPFPITLEITPAEDSPCRTLTAHVQTARFGQGLRTETKSIPLTSPAPAQISLSPMAQTVFLDTCPGQAFSLSNLRLVSPRGAINYALKPSPELQCYQCQLLASGSGLLTVKPTQTHPTFVVTSVAKQAVYLTPMYFRPDYYIPLVLCAVILSVLVGLTWRRPRHFMAAALSLIVTGWFIWRWDILRSSFPPPTITAAKIVGLAHFTALPLLADTSLFFILLFIIVGVAKRYD